MKNDFSSKNLKKAIEEEGRTIKWIAKEIGVAVNTIHRYMSGATQPSASAKILMAERLNRSLSYLEGRKK